MITVIAPHPDDAELGASVFLGPGARILTVTGTGARMVEQVAAAVFAGLHVEGLHWPEGDVTADSRLVSAIEPWARESHAVLSPPTADTHQDHRAVADAVRSALRRSPTALLEYETPSATPSWEPNVFVPMTESDLARQQDMLARYTSQRERAYFRPSWLRARAEQHGFRIGTDYAQAFRLVTTGAVSTVLNSEA